MKNEQGNEFLIFWIHIVYEGHIYLCNLLQGYVDQYVQQRIPKRSKLLKRILATRLGTTKFGHFMVLKGANNLT
jgi:hypothetical protein